jgi:hypothetical protein
MLAVLLSAADPHVLERCAHCVAALYGQLWHFEALHFVRLELCCQVQHHRSISCSVVRCTTTGLHHDVSLLVRIAALSPACEPWQQHLK